MSRAVAPPMLTIKPACFSLTCAPPTVRPRRPQSSMSLAAKCPSGRLNVLPALGNEFVVNIKDTSVLNVISVSELFFISKSAAGTYYKYFEVFFITSVIYFVMTFATTRLLRLLEKKMDGPENYTIHGSQTVPEGEIKLKGENAQ